MPLGGSVPSQSAGARGVGHLGTKGARYPCATYLPIFEIHVWKYKLQFNMLNYYLLNLPLAERTEV